VTTRRNRLIDEYLQRFDNASVFLAADRREELRQEILEHIDAGLEEADALHAAAARAVLDRLGPPADIVAAELNGPRSTGSTPVVELPVLAADMAPKHEPNDRVSHVRQTPDDVPALPVASPPIRKRVTLILIGAAAAFAVGALTFGVSTDSGDPQQQSPAIVEETSMPPSPSEESGSEPPTWAPTDDTTPVPPSDEPSEPLYDPTAPPP
jgi:hypothetical protein